MSNIMDAIEAYGTAKDDEFDPFAYPKNKSMKILIVGKNDHSTNRLLLALLIAKKLSITKDIERSKVIIITSDESLMNLSLKFFSFSHNLLSSSIIHSLEFISFKDLKRLLSFSSDFTLLSN